MPSSRLPARTLEARGTGNPHFRCRFDLRSPKAREREHFRELHISGTGQASLLRPAPCRSYALIVRRPMASMRQARRGRPHRALFPLQGSLAGTARRCGRIRAGAGDGRGRTRTSIEQDEAAEWGPRREQVDRKARPRMSIAPRLPVTGRISAERPQRRWSAAAENDLHGAEHAPAGRFAWLGRLMPVQRRLTVCRISRRPSASPPPAPRWERWCWRF